MTQERRRHVRVKPTSDAPAGVVIAMEGPLREAVDVVDISVGGMALAALGKPARAAVGDKLALQLSLGRWGEHAIDVIVRWSSPAAIGVEFADPPHATAHAIGHYVAELLARGA